MSGLSEKDFERFVLLHRVGPKSSINVFEIGMTGKQIRIRHGAKGKKLGMQVVKKQSIVDARNVFNDKRRQKIAEGYKVVREKPDQLNENANITNNNNNNNINNNNPNNNNNQGLRHFSFTFGQNRTLQSQQQQAAISKENQIQNGAFNNSNSNINPNYSDNEITSNVSETSSARRAKQQPPRRHHKPKKDGNLPNNKVNRRRKGRKGGNNNNGIQNNNNLQNKNKNKNKNKRKNKQKQSDLIANGHNILNGASKQISNQQSEISYESDDDNDNDNDQDTENVEDGTEYETNDEDVSNNSQDDSNDPDDEEDEDSDYQDSNSMYMNGNGNINPNNGSNNNNNRNNKRKGVPNGNIPNGNNNNSNNNNNIVNGQQQATTSDNEDDGDDSDGSDNSSSSSSSSSGRSSDDEYEMEYEKMAQIMADIVSKDPPKKMIWKPLSIWIRYNEEIDYHAEWALAPMPRRIAGSCHELLVAYLKSSKGEILTRLIKLARDPDEDNKHHFETERKVSQYLTKMAKIINKSFHTRNDVCIWPVETIYFEYEDEMKWATVQAPFLPKNNYVFVKIEPNYGKPCVNDAIVGRYQHAFAAISKGLDLVRDWQGYGVNQSTFLKECKNTHVPEAAEQIIERINGNDEKTQVLVVIDPVLTTCSAHYETNNPTDFGMKAIDEWLETHDCNKCRCQYFYLKKNELRFGIADPNQEWFEFNKSPMYLEYYVKKCRKELGIWQNNNDGWNEPNINDIDKNELNMLGIKWDNNRIKRNYNDNDYNNENSEKKENDDNSDGNSIVTSARSM